MSAKAEIEMLGIRSDEYDVLFYPEQVSGSNEMNIYSTNQQYVHDHQCIVSETNDTTDFSYKNNDYSGFQDSHLRNSSFNQSHVYNPRFCDDSEMPDQAISCISSDEYQDELLQNSERITHKIRMLFPKVVHAKKKSFITDVESACIGNKNRVFDCTRFLKKSSVGATSVLFNAGVEYNEVFEETNSNDTWKIVGEYCIESNTKSITDDITEDEDDDDDDDYDEEDDSMFYRSCTCRSGSRLNSPCTAADNEFYSEFE